MTKRPSDAVGSTGMDEPSAKRSIDLEVK